MVALLPPADDAETPQGTPPPSAGGEQYFEAKPTSSGTRRELNVEIAGRELSVTTAGGTFSPGHIDLGTRVLLREVPDPPSSGELLDLGCGWGPITLALGILAPGARVWAVDVNERALELVTLNARAAASTLSVSGDKLAKIKPSLPDDVPDDVRFAAIWSNPPIRIGKEALHALLLRWLPRLEPGGTAHLVVQKNLGADSLQKWLREELGAQWQVDREASAKGFRLLAVTAPDVA